MALQALVPHEQQLHGLIEGYFMATQKPDAAARADARHGRVHLIRIDALSVSALKAEKNRAIRTVTDAGQRERAVQTNGNLARRLEKTVALELADELVRCAH